MPRKQRFKPSRKPKPIVEETADTIKEQSSSAIPDTDRAMGSDRDRADDDQRRQE